MNKFLLILLIVFVASTEVQHFDMRKLGNSFKVYDWLKCAGLYNSFIEKAKKFGRPSARKFCEDHVPSILKGLCKAAVDALTL